MREREREREREIVKSSEKGGRERKRGREGVRGKIRVRKVMLTFSASASEEDKHINERTTKFQNFEAKNASDNFFSTI